MIDDIHVSPGTVYVVVGAALLFAVGRGVVEVEHDQIVVLVGEEFTKHGIYRSYLLPTGQVGLRWTSISDSNYLSPLRDSRLL